LYQPEAVHVESEEEEAKFGFSADKALKSLEMANRFLWKYLTKVWRSLAICLTKKPISLEKLAASCGDTT